MEQLTQTTSYRQSLAFRSVRAFHLEEKTPLVCRPNVRFRRPLFVSSSLENGGNLVSFRGSQTRTTRTNECAPCKENTPCDLFENRRQTEAWITTSPEASMENGWRQNTVSDPAEEITYCYYECVKCTRCSTKEMSLFSVVEFISRLWVMKIHTRCWNKGLGLKLGVQILPLCFDKNRTLLLILLCLDNYPEF